jgi:hypothetical protein
MMGPLPLSMIHSRSLRMPPLNPLPSAFTSIQKAVHSKRLAGNLNPLESAFTQNVAVTPLECAFTKTGGRPLRLTPSYKIPYVLPSSVSSKSFVCHSYENCRRVPNFFPFWSTSIRPQHHRNGPHQDLQVQPQTPPLDVLQVQLHARLKRRIAPRRDLP